MYYNLYCLIINKVPINNYRNIALCSRNFYRIVMEIYERKKNAVKDIEKWWLKYKLPIDVSLYSHKKHCEFLINFRYFNSGYNIPNLINFNNVWLMVRYYNENHYIYFNRNEDNIHNYTGFIIGRTDYYQKFYKLTNEEFLICLKRYGRCVHPKTNIIWNYFHNVRKPIGKIDKYYNIFMLEF